MNDIKGIHIEPTNICTLKCFGCARTKFINQWPQHWKNHSLDVGQLLNFLDIDLTDKNIGLCGNYGDPIYHPDFIELVTKLKARGAKLSIITNGSYKNHDWWKSLVDKLTANDMVTFSVDGTPSNFTKYRVNADWESIQTGMKVVANSLCQSVWKYIPFSFNQNNIAEVKTLSDQIGIDKFLIEPSDRFDDKTDSLKPDNKLLGVRYSAQINWKLDNRSTSIDPKCNKGLEHFITAEGYYTPCCYLADHRFYYKTPFGKNKTQYDIQHHTLTEILQRPSTVEFYQTLHQQSGCQYNCPTIKG